MPVAAIVGLALNTAALCLLARLFFRTFAPLKLGKSSN
jgi:hypothetical protein